MFLEIGRLAPANGERRNSTWIDIDQPPDDDETTLCGYKDRPAGKGEREVL